MLFIFQWLISQSRMYNIGKYCYKVAFPIKFLNEESQKEDIFNEPLQYFLRGRKFLSGKKDSKAKLVQCDRESKLNRLV